MTAMYRPWLPQAALEGGAVETMLEALLDQWSRKWFARRPMRLTGRLARQPARDGTAGDGRPWQVLEDGFAIGGAAGGRDAIARAMLDAGREDAIASAADETVAELLAEGCLEDLKARASRLLRAAPECPWQAADTLDPAMFDRALCGCVGSGADRPAIRLAIAADLVVAMVKLAVRSAPAPVLLQPMAQAVGRQPVRVTAFVGTVELPLSEVAGLDPGDVLVLDSNIDAPLPLAVDAGSRSGRCRVDDDGERLRLQLSQPYFE